MCLTRIFQGKERREAMAKLPKDFPVWKCLWYNRFDGNWHPPRFGTTIHITPGPMIAPFPPEINTTQGQRYTAYWHANLTRAGARRFIIPTSGTKRYTVRGWHIVKCMARKSDVQYMGEQLGHVVVVLSRIVFPRVCGKPPKEVTKR